MCCVSVFEYCVSVCGAICDLYDSDYTRARMMLCGCCERRAGCMWLGGVGVMWQCGRKYRCVVGCL